MIYWWHGIMYICLLSLRSILITDHLILCCSNPHRPLNCQCTRMMLGRYSLLIYAQNRFLQWGNLKHYTCEFYYHIFCWPKIIVLFQASHKTLLDRINKSESCIVTITCHLDNRGEDDQFSGQQKYVHHHHKFPVWTTSLAKLTVYSIDREDQFGRLSRFWKQQSMFP